MFEIVNAVNAIFGFDKPISESKNCKLIAHAKTNNMQIEIVPDYKSTSALVNHIILNTRKSVHWCFHIWRTIQKVSDDVEYVGRWEGFYIYAHASDSGVN